MSSSSSPKYAAAACVLLALLPVLLTGCWSRVEINDRTFVIAMFVDLTENNQIEVTLGFPEPNKISSQSGTASTGDKPPYVTLTERGINLSDAVQNMQSNLSRQIFWGQIKVIVIGAELAKQGIRPLLDFVSRNPILPLKTFVLTASGKAKDLADFPTRVEKFPSEVFRELANRRTILDTSIRNLMMAQDYSQAGITAIVEPGRGTENGIPIRTDGAALYKDNKLAGTLSKPDMRGAMWLMNRMEQAIITLHSPTDALPVSLHIQRTRTDVKPTLEQGWPVYKVQVQFVSIVNASDSDIDLKDPKQVHALETIAADQIKQRMRKAFDKSRKLKADVFQLASYLEWYYPKQWNQFRPEWDQIYSEKVKLDIEIKPTIYTTGALKNHPRESR